MRQRLKKLSANIILILGSLVSCLALLLLGEIICRSLCDFPFLTTSRNLFMTNAYGTSIGNARNIEAICFGTKVYTNEYGFRISKVTDEHKNNYKEAILILGDSVGFGGGVEENKTFSGRLRSKFPSIKIYNSSVVGYNVFDYKNVVEHFLPFHNEINRIYLIFCLNDISYESVQKIENVLAVSRVDENFPKGFISSMNDINFIWKLNEFLRARSKLYLLIRHILTDSQLLYWEADQDLYADKNNLRFEKIMQSVVDIERLLSDKGKIFTVIIVPYAVQLREDNNPAIKIPQEKLGRFLKKMGIDYVDAFKKFKNSNINPKKLFLPEDAMHLSEEGHKVIYEIISETLRTN